jgi:hypothetical protein
METVTITRADGTCYRLEPTPSNEVRITIDGNSINYLSTIAAIRFAHAMAKGGSKLITN